MIPPYLRCSSLLLLASTAFAQITPGNLVVVRVGDGSAALSSASTALFLDQFDRTTPGAALSTLAMPVAPSGANLPVTNSGSATSEGFLTQSSDGRYLVTVGYAAIPGVASIVGTTAAATPRVITRIALDGTVDSSTSVNNAFSANNIRAACTEDGSQFWAAGANSGIVLAAYAASTGTSLNTAAPTNLRVPQIFNGQLLTTSGSGTTTRGINAVGTGVPTVAGQTLTILNGMTSGVASPYDFWFADAQTVYVADDRNSALGGIQKWTESAGTWTLQYTLSPGTNIGCRGLNGVRDLGGNNLWATTTDNRLVSLLDTGAGSTFTTLATAPANTAFRGVRFVRQPYSVTISGSPCATVAGIPTVGTAGGPPVSGNANFGLTIANGAAGLPYITVISINAFVGPGFPLSFIGGPPCALLYTPAFDILLSGTIDGLGNGLTPLSLGTPDASLWGLDLAVQHLLLDPLYLAFDLPFATTEALQIEIGS